MYFYRKYIHLYLNPGRYSRRISSAFLIVSFKMGIAIEMETIRPRGIILSDNNSSASIENEIGTLNFE